MNKETILKGKKYQIICELVNNTQSYSISWGSVMNDCDSIIEKIGALAESQNMSISELSRRSGLSQPTTHRIMTGQSKSPKLQSLYALAEAVGADIPTLIKETPASYNSSNVPLKRISNSGVIDDTGEYIHCPFDRVGDGFAFKVTQVFGLAMQPATGRAFPEGSIVFVDKGQAKDCAHGDIVAALVQPENVFVFRVLQRLGGSSSLIALNSAYPPISSDFIVIGKVLGAVLN